MVASQKSQKGFTIVETLLVLAVTGALVAGILFGVGASVNAQRYRDSATTLKSFFQDQYSELSNVRNDRDSNWSCDDQARTAVGGASVKDRGQSDCLVLGRYISITDGVLTSVTVNGIETNTDTSGTDFSIMADNYTLALSAGALETDEMEWGTTMSAINLSPLSAKSNKIAVLLLRSPNSGSMYTFIDDNPPSVDDVTAAILRGMIDTSKQGAHLLCVESNGLTLDSYLSVQIDKAATGPTAIQSQSNDLLADGVSC